MTRTRPPYPEEFRREAVALIRSGQRTLAEASRSLGVSQQTLRTWLKREDVDAGRVDGVSREEREELRRLRREVRVLREEREILKKGLSSRFGGDSSVRERDDDAGAAEVDHGDQGVGGVESVGPV
jgi:transposase